MEESGCLIVHRDAATLETAVKKLGEDDDAAVLSRGEALEAEPLLKPEACAGGIRYRTDRLVQPGVLIDALLGALERKGVDVRGETPCLGVERDDSKVVGVRTHEGVLCAGAVVLAAGAHVQSLTRDLGVRIPVQGGRGYSFDVRREELPLRQPLYVYDGRLAMTPFHETTRVTSMMELGARTPTVRPTAIEAMNRVGERTFRSSPRGRPGDAWAGLRPMTPDGLPVIGPVADDVYVAGGHGMLGVTLSLRTGKAIADCVRDGGCTDPLLQPFSPRRFG
jgi:D-amino-acid dehydrogenase